MQCQSRPVSSVLNFTVARPASRPVRRDSVNLAHVLFFASLIFEDSCRRGFAYYKARCLVQSSAADLPDGLYSQAGYNDALPPGTLEALNAAALVIL